MESNSVNFINDLKKEVNSHMMFNWEVQGVEIFIVSDEKSNVSCFKLEEKKWKLLNLANNYLKLCFSELCFFCNPPFPHIHCYVSKMDTWKELNPFKITDVFSQPLHQALSNKYCPQKCVEHNTGCRGNRLGSAWLSWVW